MRAESAIVYRESVYSDRDTPSASLLTSLVCVGLPPAPSLVVSCRRYHMYIYLYTAMPTSMYVTTCACVLHLHTDVVNYVEGWMDGFPIHVLYMYTVMTVVTHVVTNVFTHIVTHAPYTCTCVWRHTHENYYHSQHALHTKSCTFACTCTCIYV